jgi:hypothetical protein
MRKIQFIALLAIASCAGIQESQGYRITCPAANKIIIDNQYEEHVQFFGEARNENGAPIKMESYLRPWSKIDPKNITFDDAGMLRGQVACYYFYANEGFTLFGNPPAGVNCQTANPVSDYVECH